MADGLRHLFRCKAVLVERKHARATKRWQRELDDAHDPELRRYLEVTLAAVSVTCRYQ
jgi:hypothetical protein